MTSSRTLESNLRTVVPGEEGYMLPEDEVPWNFRRFPEQPRGAGCCGSSAQTKAQAMTYVGDGSGQYVIETRYKYIGTGGQFNLVEAEQERRPGSLPCWCSWVPVLIVAALAMLIFGWLFLPERGWHQAASPPAQYRQTPPAESMASSTPTSLFLSMDVRNVDWEKLHDPNEDDLYRRFSTEVAAGVAVVVGEGVTPDDVVVSLSPNSDTVQAIVVPPKSQDVSRLRSTTAANHDRVAEGVMHSLEMMRRIEEIKRAPIRVENVRVDMLSGPPDEAG